MLRNMLVAVIDLAAKLKIYSEDKKNVTKEYTLIFRFFKFIFSDCLTISQPKLELDKCVSVSI